MYTTIPGGKEHGGEVLDQSQAKTRRANSKFCISMFDVRGLLRFPAPSNLTSAAHCSLGPLPHCLQFSLADVAGLWPLQHCGLSSAIHTSFSQLHSVASLGLHAGTPLSHTWLQHPSLTLEEDVTPSLLGYSCL